ncbi:acyl-CoA thioesterase domain-containing protein [Thalassolituus sp.]|jgi:acyl-CoA thioesterase|uniref:acyl-CoA thioesterase domain-containing protein n=1 Tax=Thalassolituus sp. TaxID=2030822 RepID=UPI002A7FF7E1|nr:acyl-CoA thioesterase domain-containing protein [Thalassolituus sp.]
MQRFDHYYQAAETQADIILDGSWGQGKTTFGGMSTVLALAAIEADIREAYGGYAHTEARIFSADGTLLALSRQLVVVYDRRD